MKEINKELLSQFHIKQETDLMNKSTGPVDATPQFKLL